MFARYICDVSTAATLRKPTTQKLIHILESRRELKSLSNLKGPNEMKYIQKLKPKVKVLDWRMKGSKKLNEVYESTNLKP